MANRLFQRPGPEIDLAEVTEDELVQVAKFVLDRAVKHLDMLVAAMESRLTKTLQNGYERRVSYVHKSLGERLDDLTAKHEKGMAEFGTAIEAAAGPNGPAIDEMGLALRTAKLLGDRLEKQLAEQQARHNQEIEQLKTFMLERIQDIRDANDNAWGAVKTLLGALPVPQVVLPDSAIEVKLLPSVVNLPPEAIVVRSEVKQLPSVVNISQKAAQVNFPEKALQVNVQAKAVVEKTKVTTKKSIVYNEQTGRPSEIIEERMEP